MNRRADWAGLFKTMLVMDACIGALAAIALAIKGIH
jgi:hypothetical protein